MFSEAREDFMQLALIGYGKMGKMIERLASSRGHTIVAKLGPTLDFNPTALQEAHVCIDFSVPEAVEQHIDLCASLNKPLVIGTTGWYSKLETIKKKVDSANIGVIYSPNFSLGVNLFLQLVKEAARLTDPFEGYDVAGCEIHHNQKEDSPSGTSQAITKAIIENFQRKKKALYECVNRKLDKEELQFTSLRVGTLPGKHLVMFDSSQDTITLTHSAKSREGFAEGALIAAEWLLDKKGFFSIEDLLKTIGTEKHVV